MAAHSQRPPTPAGVRFKVGGDWFPPMVDDASVLPADMLRFIDTPVAQPLVRGRNIAFGGSIVLAIVLFLLMRQFAFSSPLSASLAGLTLLMNAVVVWLRFQSHASTPLAVNLNHPFMDTEPMGDARLLVQLTDGRWIAPGEHRVRAVPDDLLGGFTLVQDTEDYPALGHFSNAKELGGTLTRHLALINQAIALRDAVNEVHDPIEDARSREKMDTGLLERSWLEDEEAVEVESPLVSFFRGKE